jgi:hypothetical protein
MECYDEHSYLVAVLEQFCGADGAHDDLGKKSVKAGVKVSVKGRCEGSMLRS